MRRRRLLPGALTGLAGSRTFSAESHPMNTTNTAVIIIGTAIVVLLLVLVFGGGSMMPGGMMHW